SAVKARLAGDFSRYGAELVDFYVSRITPPDEVERMIDERSGMAAVGDLDAFLKFKAAKAIGDAATRPNGGGGAAGCDSEALTVGIGAGLGAMLPGMLFKRLDPAAGSPGKVQCTDCHGDVAIDSRFCPHCGHQMVAIRKCPRCDKNVTAQ